MPNLIPTAAQAHTWLMVLAFLAGSIAVGWLFGEVLEPNHEDDDEPDLDAAPWLPTPVLIALLYRRAAAAVVRGVLAIARAVLALVVGAGQVVAGWCRRHPLFVLRVVTMSLATGCARAAWLAAVFHNDPEDGVVFGCIAIGLVVIGWGVDSIDLEPRREWR